MATGSWFKAHKKSLTIHTLVIVGFVLFTIFASEPLFDRLERISGEAQLQQLQLPAETNNIRYGIDSISIEGHTGVEIVGWAFVEGQDSKNRELYIVLKSAHQTYVFNSQVMLKPHLIEIVEESCLNMQYSGFKTIIPTRKIGNGEYAVGVYIKGEDIEALQYTDSVVEY